VEHGLVATDARACGVSRTSQPRIAVTVLIPQLARGGAEMVATEIANRVDRTRFDVEVCVGRRPELPDMRAALAKTGLRVIELDRTSVRNLRPWAGLVRHLRARPTDILHAHTFGSNVWASVVGRLARTPAIIATEHTWSYEGQPARIFLDRHLVGRNAAFVAVSELDRSRMIEIERVPAEVIRVIPNGYLGAASAAGAPSLRAELGIEDEGLIVGTVAGLRPQKALDMLIRAFADVRERFPAAHLVLIGEGDERASLERLVASLGLAGAVTLLGDRPDAVGLMAQFDVFALSSAFEGSPLALIEAMWWSRPIVATSVGGIPEMIVDGESGLLVPPRSPRALGDAIARMLGDAGLRAALGARAREHAVAVHSIERCVGAWEGLYSELYERTRRGRVNGR
jgi:glycosyltransferase involved in cell wall biosynthesis